MRKKKGRAAAMALFRRRPPAAGPTDPGDAAGVETADPDLPPSRMRGTEPLYGYVVALELLVVAILNVVITTGKGAPPHPQTGLQIVGIVAPLALVAVLQTRNRTIAGFAAIVAAFFVTLPRVPNSLGVAHVFALAVPLVYGLMITQRQRKATGNALKTGRRGAAAGGRSRDQSRPEGRRRGRKRDATPEIGPRPSARYTPPKAKRGKARR